MQNRAFVDPANVKSCLLAYRQLYFNELITKMQEVLTFEARQGQPISLLSKISLSHIRVLSAIPLYIRSELIPRWECVWIFHQRHHLLMPAAAVHGEVRMYIALLVLDAT